MSEPCKHASQSWADASQVLDKAQVERAHMVGQIKHEVSIMRRLKHPNVVELKDVMATQSKAGTSSDTHTQLLRATHCLGIARFYRASCSASSATDISVSLQPYVQDLM